MTVTLKQLIEWRDALEPVGHCKLIQVEGLTGYLHGAKVVALNSAFHELSATVEILSKGIEIPIEVPA